MGTGLSFYKNDFNGATSNMSITSISNITDNTWRHIALVYTSSTPTSTAGNIASYVNGNNVVSISTSSSIKTLRNANYIGSFNAISGTFFLDLLAIFVFMKLH